MPCKELESKSGRKLAKSWPERLIIKAPPTFSVVVEILDYYKVTVHPDVTEAVDKVRRNEHKQILKQGDERLKGTRHLWLSTKKTFLNGSGNLHCSINKPLSFSCLTWIRIWAGTSGTGNIS
jgi:hypothetical protein